MLFTAVQCHLSLLGALQVSGEVNISEFASMGDHDDIAFSVTTIGTSQAHQQLKQAVEALRPQIFARLDQYGEELHDS